MSAATLIYLVIALAGITLLVLYFRSGKLVKNVLFTLFSGLLAFLAVFLLSGSIGLNISATPLSLLMSGVLGVPGVFFMLVLNLL